jgi:hypothetical protein
MGGKTAIALTKGILLRFLKFRVLEINVASDDVAGGMASAMTARA